MAHDEDDLDPTTEGARSFARFIEFACSGAVHADASQELHEMLGKLRARAQRNNGAKGSITLTINIALDDADQAQLTYSVKSKVPEPSRRKGAAWLTRGGNLTPDNPRQRSLPLVEVHKPPRPMTDHRADRGA